jgi:undecaprenyl-diphosphatase
LPTAQLPPSLTERIRAFDRWADELADRVRGNAVADRVFYAASEVGDFSVLWHFIGALRGLRSDKDADEAIRLIVLLGGESVAVNGVIKSFFRRTRPDWDQDRAYAIRKPRSSSFPSGHASAAFFAATVLGEDNPAAIAYFALAAVVASSRVYVKIHHASDIVAGAATGVTLGLVARKLWPKAK